MRFESLFAHLVIAIVIVADDRVAHAEPAAVEWTYWFGPGVGIALQPDDRDSVYGFRLGVGVDFELVQFDNPLSYGGKFHVRWGPWLIAETRTDTHYVHGGLAIDFGQTRHAQFGTYTLRGGGGIDIDGHPLASLTFLGGVRHVPDRSGSRPKIAFASGGRVFGMITTDGGGGRSLLFGIEFEPTWILPPYSLHKLGGVNN